MKKSLYAVIALGILLLSGCASNRFPIQPILERTQSPEPAGAYIAGMFSRDWNPSRTSFGIGIVNTATSEEYVMPFGVETILPERVTDEFVMIQLPPGRYKVEYWITYATGDGEMLNKTDISPESLSATPFELAAGKAVFLGSYVARSGKGGAGNEGNSWSVYHQRLTPQVMRKGLLNRYPSFSRLPMSCPSCLN